MNIKVLSEKNLDNVVGGLSSRGKMIARGAIKGSLCVAGGFLRIPINGIYLSDHLSIFELKLISIFAEARMQAEAGYKLGEWICKKLNLEES